MGVLSLLERGAREVADTVNELFLRLILRLEEQQTLKELGDRLTRGCGMDAAKSAGIFEELVAAAREFRSLPEAWSPARPGGKAQENTVSDGSFRS